MDSVAVLLTCYNRYQETLNCLERLLHQNNSSEFQLDVYLVDDASPDETGRLVIEHYPNVHILHGNGKLFWNGGMRKAWCEAQRVRPYDYYLWLNDDVELDPQALSRMLEMHRTLTNEQKGNSVIVGTFKDPDTNSTSYGGLIRISRLFPLRFRVINPMEGVKQCNTMNGNCVLIPNTVARKLGNLEQRFSHSMGDFDYGLRAVKQGVGVYNTGSYEGICAKNKGINSWHAVDQSLFIRIRRILEEKGLPPLEWLLFVRRHAGPFWPIYWCHPYVKLVLGHLVSRTRIVFVSFLKLVGRTK